MFSPYKLSYTAWNPPVKHAINSTQGNGTQLTTGCHKNFLNCCFEKIACPIAFLLQIKSPKLHFNSCPAIVSVRSVIVLHLTKEPCRKANGLLITSNSSGIPKPSASVIQKPNSSSKFTTCPPVIVSTNLVEDDKFATPFHL